MPEVVESGLVTQVTGPGSLNEIAGPRWDVYGTDLGNMFWHEGELYMVFGDTFGEGGLHENARNWRSQTLARLGRPNPEQGLCIESMITGANGAAKELIPSRKIEGEETTVVPTHGISMGGRMYLHYSSIRSWGGGTGQWDVGHSGFAYSDDSGESWTVPQDAVSPPDTGFEQVALVQQSGRVYMFGIPGGRFGSVRLRRVHEGDLLNLQAYEYWNGSDWVTEQREAIMIVPGPVGEFSVAWNALHDQWMMLYFNIERRAVMLRMASQLTGPWSEGQIVVTAQQFPGLYAPYIVPVSGIGEDVYYTLSLWEPYNVFLMHLRLESTVSDPLITENDPEEP